MSPLRSGLDVLGVVCICPCSLSLLGEMKNLSRQAARPFVVKGHATYSDKCGNQIEMEAGIQVEGLRPIGTYFLFAF